MNVRTTTGRALRSGRSRLCPPTAARRPGLYLGAAAAGALVVNLLVGVDAPAQADATAGRSISVAHELGLTSRTGSADMTADLEPLQDLAASRSSRSAAQAAAQQAQAAAVQAELDRQKAAAEAAAQAATQAAAQAAASATAAAPSSAAAVPAAAGTAVTEVAHISNSAGPVRPQTQAAANQVVSNVPGADAITLGGTRPSATDPHGHPSGLALDYMVLSDTALGEAIVAYHIAHWSELGVEYLIYKQRMLSSPTGSWVVMEDRGSPTENHMDHVHVNYR